MLHAGHELFLCRAKGITDYFKAELVIGLNSDESIRELKGLGRPIQSAVARSLNLVSYGRVEIFSDSDELVRRLNPEIIIRGHDQNISTEDKKHIVVRLPKLADISTTKILGEPKSILSIHAVGRRPFVKILGPFVSGLRTKNF